MDVLSELIARYPRLFRGEGPGIPSGLLPGWARLVNALLTEIDGLLTDEQAQRFEVWQIKEKFGTLRFYWKRYHFYRLSAEIDRSSERTPDEYWSSGKIHSKERIETEIRPHTHNEIPRRIRRLHAA